MRVGGAGLRSVRTGHPARGRNRFVGITTVGSPGLEKEVLGTEAAGAGPQETPANGAARRRAPRLPGVGAPPIISESW